MLLNIEEACLIISGEKFIPVVIGIQIDLNQFSDSLIAVT